MFEAGDESIGSVACREVQEIVLRLAAAPPASLNSRPSLSSTEGHTGPRREDSWFNLDSLSKSDVTPADFNPISRHQSTSHAEASRELLDASTSRSQPLGLPRLAPMTTPAPPLGQTDATIMESQTLVGAMSRASPSSRPDDGDDENDTQPFPSWVHDVHSKKVILSQEARNGNVVGPEEQPPLDRDITEKSSHLSSELEEPENGDSEPVPEVPLPPVRPELKVLENSAFQVPARPEAHAATSPNTPAVYGKKRRYDGELVAHAVSSVSPGQRLNPLARHRADPSGMMGLSQVFGATQPQTPFRPGLTSDPLSDRPSPDFFNAQRMAALASVSSPLSGSKDVSSPATGKRTAYMSMLESQEERERLRRERFAMSDNVDHDDPSSDEGLSLESSATRRRLRKAKIEHETKKMLENITAPRRDLAQDWRRVNTIAGSPGGGKATDYSSSRPLVVQAEVGEPLPDKHPLYNGASEEETEIEDEDNSLDASPDVHQHHAARGPGGIQVPMTTIKGLSSHRTAVRTPGSPTRHSILPLPATPDFPERHKGLRPSVAETVKSKIPERSSNQTGTQTIAIVDSQPSLAPANVAPRKDQLEAREIEPPSSLESHLFASQSQPMTIGQPLLTRAQGADSHLAEDESSSLPQPPRTSEEDEDSWIPRSPPTPRTALLRSRTRRRVRIKKGKPTFLEAADAVSRDESPPPVDGPVESHGGTNGTHSTNHSGSSIDESNLERSTLHAGLSRNGPQIAQGEVRNVQHALNLDAVKGIIPETSPACSPARNSAAAVPDSDSAGEVVPRHITADDSSSRLADVSLVADQPLIRPASSSQARSSPNRELLPPSTPVQHPSNPRLRTLTEIAEDPSPHRSFGEVELDFSLVNSQDVEFHTAVEGSSPVAPARKRRRLIDSRMTTPAESVPIPCPTDENETTGAASVSELVSEPSTIGSRIAKTAETGRTARKQTKKAALAVTAVKRNATESAKSARTETDIPIPSSDFVGAAKPLRARLAQTYGRHRTPQKPSEKSRGGPEDHQSRRDSVPANSISPGQEEPAQAHDSPHPERVFALFKGLNLAYYPATFLGTGPQDQSIRVRFDDGTADTIDISHVRSLDLKKGDIVKVDLTNMRTKNYIVCSFKDRRLPTSMDDGSRRPRSSATARTKAFPQTDIHGYKTAILSPKPHNKAVTSESSVELVEVPITSIYIVQSNWIHFNDRSFHPALVKHQKTPRETTPLQMVFTPATPPSRRRRGSIVKFDNSTTPLTEPKKSSGGVFTGMMFAVSYLKNETEKQRVIRLINGNGGKILEEGFVELFELPPLDERPVPGSDTLGSFKLTQDAESVGFACLIADQHSRREKYMQALALGLPCLAGRWVEDCIAKATALDWAPYLLPAGDSAFLRGATHSRILQPSSPTSARLATTVQARPQLLQSTSVLLVMGKGKAEERRKVYLFLSHALGSKAVARVPSLDAARKALRECDGAWDWVYVDGSEADAERALLGQTAANVTSTAAAAGLGRKGKRRSAAEAEGEQDGDHADGGGAVPGGKKVRVVGYEFVIQSLIAGRLLED